jgi:glucose-6-phosphate 1-dehydrogenase
MNDVLVEPSRQAPPCAMVVFGGAGDLTRRLLIPALYNLMRTKLLSDRFAIIGVARSPMSTEEFRQSLTDAMRDFARTRGGESGGTELDEAAWSALRERVEYINADLTDAVTYQELGRRLKAASETRGCGDSCLFYLAVGAQLFSPIIHQLAAAGLVEQKRGWRRVIIEKPFGTDFESAKRLNADLLGVLEENQIYRIDHYLGKETVQNVLVMRFGNGIFEPLWNRDHIDNIQITVAETVGVERRAFFYEKTGALRDMVPNHLFQLLTLIAMEPPTTFEANAVRNEKVKVLDAVRPFFGNDAFTNSVRGQYLAGSIGGKTVLGYRHEPNVAPDSKVETYVAMKITIDNWRWAGVPFYLRTGKSLQRRSSQIVVQFKHAPYAMFRDTSVERLTANRLILHIQPDEGVSFQFGAKIPGPLLRMRDVRMDFRYKDYFDAKPSTGYEALIYDCMLGDATLFQRGDSVESGWRVVQPIIDAWNGKSDALVADYDAGSEGPKLADELLERDGRRWFAVT